MTVLLSTYVMQVIKELGTESLTRMKMNRMGRNVVYVSHGNAYN